MTDLLSDKIVLITGGIVGSGIIHALLSANAKVVAPVRTDEKAALLAEEMRISGHENVDSNLVVIPGIDGTEEGISRLLDALSERKLDSLCHVISCFGGDFQHGPLSTLTTSGVYQSIDRSMPHFHLLKAWSLLNEDPMSSFLFIDGMLGERCHMPQVSGLTLSNSFLYGLILAFQAENKDSVKRINEIRIGAMIRKSTAESRHPFLSGSTKAYPASLVGEEVVRVCTNTSINNEIVRITSESLENKLN
eukprot:jgi/Picsp_1/1802/NSC_05269-R1_short-chain dehydrogenase reductase sdr